MKPKVKITVEVDGRIWSTFVHSTEGGRQEKFLDDDGEELSDALQFALTALESAVNREGEPEGVWP